MADDAQKPEAQVDVSTEMLQRVARELSSPKLDSRLPAKAPSPYELSSPIGQAFNRLGERSFELPTTLPFMGTPPVSYVTTMDTNGNIRQDGKRGIEYRVPDSDFRLMAGSYLPDGKASGLERWTAALAWTPVNLGGLRLGPMIGDVVQSDLREGAQKPFDRVGMSVGLYATTDGNDGGLFAKVETDPAHNNKVKAFIGYKMPFNGQ